MIHGLVDPYTKSEITFVSGNEVVALTLLEPETYLKQISIPTDQKTVGALELKRATKNIESELEKLLHFPITLQVEAEQIPENKRWDVLRTIGLLPSLLAQVTTDELGKKQVLENIATICIQSAAANKTLLNQKTLTLSVTSPLAIPVAQEKERLKKEIENIL